jgi:hypothetical protein
MAVIACEFTSRCALADGRAFGTVGPYEQLDGIAHFAVDPTSPFNRALRTSTSPRVTTTDWYVLQRMSASSDLLTPNAAIIASYSTCRTGATAWDCGCSITLHGPQLPVRRSIPGMGS